MLSTCSEEQPKEWDQHLSKLCMAYNTSVHSTTGYSPFFPMFGREAHLPIDLMFGSPNLDETSYSSYVTNQQEILTKAYNKVRENTKRKQHRQKEFYNRRVHGKPYKKGELVWLFNPAVKKGYTKKFHSHGVDPIGSATNCLLTIKHTANNKFKVVHFDRLKHCPEGTWFTHKKLKDVSPSNPIQLSQLPGFSLELIEDDSDTIQRGSIVTQLNYCLYSIVVSLF